MKFYYVASKAFVSKSGNEALKIVFMDSQCTILETLVDKQLYDYFNSLKVGEDITDNVHFRSHFVNDNGYKKIVYIPFLLY